MTAAYAVCGGCADAAPDVATRYPEQRRLLCSVCGRVADCEVADAAGIRVIHLAVCDRLEGEREIAEWREWARQSDLLTVDEVDAARREP